MFLTANRFSLEQVFNYWDVSEYWPIFVGNKTSNANKNYISEVKCLNSTIIYCVKSIASQSMSWLQKSAPLYSKIVRTSVITASQSVRYLTPERCLNDEMYGCLLESSRVNRQREGEPCSSNYFFFRFTADTCRLTPS